MANSPLGIEGSACLTCGARVWRNGAYICDPEARAQRRRVGEDPWHKPLGCPTIGQGNVYQISVQETLRRMFKNR